MYTTVHDDVEWRGFCNAIGSPELTDDERFASNRARVSNQEHLYDVLAPIFERRPAIWWLRSMERSGIPAGIEHDFETFRHHVQIVENGMIAEVTTPWGVTAVGGLTWHFTQTPCEVTPPPRPGGDTDAVLATIAELERSC